MSRRNRSRRARRPQVEIIESGRRYAWGRQGDAYSVWKKRRPAETLEHTWAANARQEFRWLEQQAQLRRRRMWTRLFVAGGLVLVYPVAVGISLYVNRSSPSTLQQAQVDTVGVAVAERYVNVEGGFAFRAPQDWSVRSAASTTEVASPGGTVTISIQAAPDGDIDVASETFVESLTTGWTDTQAEAPKSRTVGDLPAVSVSGTAVDETGSPIRFLSIVADSGVRNHAISLAVPRTWDAVSFMPAIEEVLSSFRPL
jgi:hypothetical protein